MFHHVAQAAPAYRNESHGFVDLTALSVVTHVSRVDKLVHYLSDTTLSVDCSVV